MKHAFLKLLVTLTANLCAYVYKYACKDENGNGIPDFLENVVAWFQEKLQSIKRRSRK